MRSTTSVAICVVSTLCARCREISKRCSKFSEFRSCTRPIGFEVSLAEGSKLDDREDVVETRLPDSKSRCYAVCCQSSEPEREECSRASS